MEWRECIICKEHCEVLEQHIIDEHFRGSADNALAKVFDVKAKSAQNPWISISKCTGCRFARIKPQRTCLGRSRVVSLSTFFDTKPFGNEFDRYIARYWQTFVEKKTSDRSCYFLHGGIEKIPQPKKDHKIGEHMGILFSPIKWISVCEKKNFDKSKQMMKDKAIEEMDIIEDFSCYLDGELISEHATRAISDYFELDKKYMAICDGYWIFIKPHQLSIGKHHIITHAACRAGEVIRPSEFNLDIQR